jgi:hypothetical protein
MDLYIHSLIRLYEAVLTSAKGRLYLLMVLQPYVELW